jgi:hypothetical protein
VEIPPCELVLLGNAHHALDAREVLQFVLKRRGEGRTDHPNDGVLLALREVGSQAQCLDT